MIVWFNEKKKKSKQKKHCSNQIEKTWSLWQNVASKTQNPRNVLQWEAIKKDHIEKLGVIGCYGR